MSTKTSSTDDQPRPRDDRPRYDLHNTGRSAGLSILQSVYEVLTEDGNGHRTIHRVAAANEAEARKIVADSLPETKQPETIDAAPVPGLG